MVDVITAGREAVLRKDWDEALRSLTAADEDSGLGPDDLILLGDAYWWSGQPDSAVEALERAYAAYAQAGDRAQAAMVGAHLAYFAMRRMAMPVAEGWISRVERLLAGEPESAGHAWLAVLHLARKLLVEHDLPGAIEVADSAIEMSQRMDAPGAQGLAMSFKGLTLIQSGEIPEGTALIDEATVVALSEGGDLRAACDVYCNTIAACSTVGDYGRAQQWTDEAERWMHSRSLGGYTGVCQVHRAELKRLHGSWSEAEQVALEACVELERFRLLNGIGFARYEIGETRRRMGDLDGADESFQMAYEYGHSAQPGMSLLLLDRGEVEEAASSIGSALARRAGTESGTSSMLGRGRLLPAQVEIALASGDTETARAAVEELEEIAAAVQRKWWEASAMTCRGALELHQGNQEAAVEVLERAWRTWQEIDLPYESALARAMLGRARVDLGNERAGRLDLKAAANAFRDLGAAADLRRITEATDGPELTTAERERVTRVFMFTDIVTSTDLIGLIGDSGWENLLEWHDRTLRESFRRHHGEEVRHTGDGFFVAFDSARSALDCAVAIQRSLAEHRKQHGFAPWVRIGVHVAEATRKGGDYAGGGVHAAARIGALGDQEDIIVSAAVLRAAGNLPYRVGDGREASLKGIADPVVVHDLDWR